MVGRLCSWSIVVIALLALLILGRHLDSRTLMPASLALFLGTLLIFYASLIFCFAVASEDIAMRLRLSGPSRIVVRILMVLAMTAILVVLEQWMQG